MRSQTNGHFPQVRFSAGRKWLYNPVLRKRFVNRPEERVRLQYAEFLLHQTTISRSRIGFEAPVKSESAENTLRADLVIYDRDMTPSALIECKSGHIKLNAKTAEQTARYNRSLKADYLMITNGIDDFWYKTEGQTVSLLQQHPFEMNEEEFVTSYSNEYWIKRGFFDSTLSNHSAGLARNFLNQFFTQSDSSNYTYLNLPPDISPVALDHFYRIEQTDSDDRLAISLIAGPSNQTVMAAVLNRDGQNRGVLWLPLTELLESNQPEATRLSPDRTAVIPFPKDARLLFASPSEMSFKKMVNQLINFFD